MTFTYSKPLVVVIPLALLGGCANLPPNYAPVTTNHPDAPEVSAPAKDETQYHQVKKGDTLYAISLIYDLDYRHIAQWNKIAPPYTIEVGQKLKLSGPNLGNPATDNDLDTANMPSKADATNAKSVAAPSTNRISSQKKAPIPLNNKPALAYNASIKTDSVKSPPENHGTSAQKKSIISIDNENMLKLNFQWPVKGKVLKAFSQADNKGIDIAGKMGQDVSAAESGKVVYSGQGLLGYGNLLIIKHNDLYLSAYANNSQLLVSEGRSVEKGEVIAKIGQAGSDKTSLHFEIRKNGKPVNPVNFLPEK